MHRSELMQPRFLEDPAVVARRMRDACTSRVARSVCSLCGLGRLDRCRNGLATALVASPSDTAEPSGAFGRLC